MRKKKSDTESNATSNLGHEEHPEQASLGTEPRVVQQQLGAEAVCVKAPDSSTVVCGIVVDASPAPSAPLAADTATKPDE